MAGLLACSVRRMSQSAMHGVRSAGKRSSPATPALRGRPLRRGLNVRARPEAVPRPPDADIHQLRDGRFRAVRRSPALAQARPAQRVRNDWSRPPRPRASVRRRACRRRGPWYGRGRPVRRRRGRTRRGLRPGRRGCQEPALIPGSPSPRWGRVGMGCVVRVRDHARVGAGAELRRAGNRRGHTPNPTFPHRGGRRRKTPRRVAPRSGHRCGARTFRSRAGRLGTATANSFQMILPRQTGRHWP